MTPQIKQRIEQIRRGEVPDGYKRTKVGLVPEEWDTPKAKEIFSSVSDKKYNENLEVLSATQDRGVIPRSQVDIDIKYDKSSVLGYKKVSKGNYVISLRSFQGGIEYSEYDGLVSPAYIVLKEKREICQLFFKTYFKTDDYIKRLAVATYGIRDGKSISFEDFGTLRIPFPPLFEQEKIAEILQTQDKLIELQQKKIEELKKLKKAYLSKMFPKKGCNVPEIRFPGFTDPWEQRKLGDIADIVGGGTPSTGNQSYWDGDIDWYAPAEIADQIYANSSQKKITGLGYENSSAKMLPPGTVLFTSRAGIGKTAILTRKGCTNQGFQSIVPHRGELDSYFIFSRTEELKRYGELVGAGSTFVEVSGKQMAVMELMMPPTMREQQTIGGFFQQLDHLITLHQRKLEEMKKYKKSLMQLLLTGIVRM